jgi:type III restriction enzyme
MKMMMNKTQAIQYLINTMSLRAPQSRSLILFADYLENKAGTQILNRQKDKIEMPALELITRSYAKNVNELVKFENFERSFPSYTFSLATGVGKTRLMGAFVAYLSLVYDFKYYLIVTPGNTIYRKLVEDFSDASKPKYVFKGLKEFSSTKVKIVTKENYEQHRKKQLFDNNVDINIFNIQQFSQQDLINQKGITKFSEFLGESYFDYLKNLENLVILMDESHHYSSISNLKSLDRIDPLFGLEFTATPYILEGTSKKNLVSKKNIFYLYNLGNAIRDEYVKEPWIGTEADIDFTNWDPNSVESDIRKLQLAAYFHERAKFHLKRYSEENDKKLVKPVLLVVAKDIYHANELSKFINSNKFRDGLYVNKVITIHTKQTGEASDKAIEDLLSLEDSTNLIEIVVHVNMLKEGWDVANIYTIAPMRTSAAQILTEQTIGRGLRLPYGERTGDEIVDKVVIVAHENYAKVIEEARNSQLIQPTNIEYINNKDIQLVKDLFKVKNIIISSVEQEIKNYPEILKILNDNVYSNSLYKDNNDENKKLIVNGEVEKIAEYLSYNQASNKYKNTELEEFINNNFDNIQIQEIKDVVKNLSSKHEIIIPKIDIDEDFGEFIIKDFNLDTNQLSKYTSEILIKEQILQQKNKKVSEQTLVTSISSLGDDLFFDPLNKIISSLQEFPLIDYSENKDLLVKLVNQAINFYEKIYKKEALHNVLNNNYNLIAEEIYNQIVKNKQFKKNSSLVSKISQNFVGIYAHNFSISRDEKIVTLDSQFNSFSRDKLYGEFIKASHKIYRFDSSDEVRFAYLLEKDSEVIKWLRPSPKQFDGLYWKDKLGKSHHNYEPDFVVELKKDIILAEIKPNKNIDDFDVQQKKIVAEQYCKVVNENINNFGIYKSWKYLIIPTEKILAQSTIRNLFSILN